LRASVSGNLTKTNIGTTYVTCGVPTPISTTSLTLTPTPTRPQRLLHPKPIAGTAVGDIHEKSKRMRIRTIMIILALPVW
jgi:hypothetical protein